MFVWESQYPADQYLSEIRGYLFFEQLLQKALIFESEKLA